MLKRKGPGNRALLVLFKVVLLAVIGSFTVRGEVKTFTL